VRLNGVERWISGLRLVAVPLAFVLVSGARYPPGYATWAWVTTGAFAAGSVALFLYARTDAARARPVGQSVVAQIFDTAVLSGYTVVFSYEAGTPVQQILYIDLAAACIRFEVLGGLLLAAASAPIVAVFERVRVHHLHGVYSWRLVGLQTGFETLMALIVGWLVRSLAQEGAEAEQRAREAEMLRDQLAHRADRADAAYEAERRTVEELRRLSSLRADFVSMVSHEVRTPMAAVIGAAQTLRGRWRKLSPEQRESFLGLISDEISRLAALVGEVLDSSRIDEGTFSYHFSELDLGLVVMDTVAAAELAHDGISLSATVADDLPAVRGDSLRLGQVLRNLIENAVKYSAEGASVEVAACRSGGAVQVEVIDHGAGIASDDQALIFEKFGRLRGSSTKPGSGLGLYISRAIAEAHDGTLEVRSVLGEGSVFTLRLPVGG